MFNFFKRKKAPEPEFQERSEVSSEETQEDISPEMESAPADRMSAESNTPESGTDFSAETVSQEPEEAGFQEDVSEPVEPVAEIAEPESESEPESEPEISQDELDHADDLAVEDILKGGDAEPVTEQEKPKSPGFFARIRAGLSRTRSGLSGGLANLLLGKKVIDDDLLEELETSLIMADVGVEATTAIMARLTERVSRKELKDSDALYAALVDELKESLQSVQQPLVPESADGPFVILMVGINGVGKTTTIGKLAHQYMASGKSVMLAAGDTFRAAAVEQLQVWGERNKVPVVAQHTGADSASVIFDAVQAAKSRGIDVLIADTAGRLHNKDNLMQELEKVVRVMKKIDPTAPHEVMLVLDAGTGQNAINQTKQFLQAVGVSGLTLTKLDGTAKGGVIFALASQFGIPVRYIGVGEGIEDLRPFIADEFINALFDRQDGAS